jgi:hypothetical protein
MRGPYNMSIGRRREKANIGKILLLGQSPATVGKRNETLRIMVWRFSTPGVLGHGTRK